MENELKSWWLTGIKFMAWEMICLNNVCIWNYYFPFIKEGLGMVAVEAQAAGLPVLASDTVPKKQIVCDEIYFKKDFLKVCLFGKGY